MHTISQFVFSLATTSFRITATLIALSVCASFAPLDLGGYAKVKAVPNPAVAAASGYLYVLNDCPACPNQIFGFAVDEGTGGLTPLPNFPVSTGGKGSNFDRGELLAMDRNNLRLFAINDDTNTVSAFTIVPATGELRPMNVNQINLSSGDWISIAVRPSGLASLVAVADSKSLDANNLGRVAGFKVTASTVTTPSFKSTRSLSPLTITFQRNGNVVYTGGGLGSQFASFRISANGTFTDDGVLFNSGENPIAYATNAGGGRLLLADRVHHILRIFTLTNGIPAHACRTFSPTGLSEVGQGVLVAHDKFYVVSDREIASNLVGVYKISGSCDGGPTFTSPSLFHSGARGINLLALNRKRDFLLALNRSALSNQSPPESPGVTTFRVNTNSGALERLATQPINTPVGHPTLNGMAYWTPFTTSTNISAPDVTRTFSPGQIASVTVIVTSSSGTPSGDVTLSVDGHKLPPKTLSGGKFTFNLIMPGVGSHTLKATFTGSAFFAPSTAKGTLTVKSEVLVTRP